MALVYLGGGARGSLEECSRLHQFRDVLYSHKRVARTFFSSIHGKYSILLVADPHPRPVRKQCHRRYRAVSFQKRASDVSGRCR